MARRVFQRLGFPSPSSMSKCTTGMRILQGPSSVLASHFLDQTDRLDAPLVRFDTGTPQVIESPQHVVLEWLLKSPGGDGWESNPPGTAQHRPTNGFEDLLLPTELEIGL